MTTLAAYQGLDWCVIGADSRATDDDGRIFQLSNAKISRNGAYVIAMTGASRGGNIIQQGWIPPKPPLTNDVNKLDIFMTRKFIPELRKVFIEAGYEGKEDKDSATQDSAFLVAVNGVIYPIFQDYSWDRDARGIYYDGSGGDMALGAMVALGIQDCVTPEEAEQIIIQAIEISTEFNAYCTPPVITIIQNA